MTTRIKITNEGPENAGVWYYGEDRKFKEYKDHLKPGESVVVDVWNGHLPVVLPIHNAPKENIDTTGRFYAIPAISGG